MDWKSASPAVVRCRAATIWDGQPFEHPQLFGEVLVGGRATLGAVKQPLVRTGAEVAFGSLIYGPESGRRLLLARRPGVGRVVYQNGTSMKPFVVLASSWLDTWYLSDGTLGLVPCGTSGWYGAGDGREGDRCTDRGCGQPRRDVLDRCFHDVLLCTDGDAGKGLVRGIICSPDAPLGGGVWLPVRDVDVRLDVNDPPVVAEVGRDDVDRRGHDGRRIDGAWRLGRERPGRRWRL